MTTPAPGQAEAAEEIALLTGERPTLPSSTESFTARDRTGNELRWEDGNFTSNWGPFLEAVREMLASKEWIAGFSTGPVTQPGSRPGWVALYTAQEALRLDELDWDERNVHFPDDMFGYPPHAVA